MLTSHNHHQSFKELNQTVNQFTRYSKKIDKSLRHSDVTRQRRSPPRLGTKR